MRCLRRRGLKTTYDIVVTGSGFAGSLMAIVAKRLGCSVLLLEKEQHPRIVIGESSTPLSNLLLETLAQRYDLPWLQPLTKWGSWQQHYPDLACGLKRGFTFFHHDVQNGVSDPAAAPDQQLLVAASPNDTIADTHWFRADFDRFLMEQAVKGGVDYLDHCHVQDMLREGQGWCLHCKVDGVALEVRARFVIDATGPRGLLHRLLGLGESPLPTMPNTSALFGHFSGVSKFTGQQQYVEGKPPYLPDDAALHHVFDGGWMWILRFNHGWTSAGFAATEAVADRMGFAEGEPAWNRILEQFPEVKQQFAEARAETPLRYVPKVSFRSAQITGEGWALLPSAAGFVDPLLSTGFPLTLLGVLRLGELLERHWGEAQINQSLLEYARETEAELLATAELIGALYANMGDFPTFRVLSLLYFAAASFAETARRLGRAELAPSFLLHSHPHFGPEAKRLTTRARQHLNQNEKAELRREVMDLVAAFDVAGLTKEPVDHCYPVRAADLFAGAAKVQANAAEIEALLKRTGFV